MCTVYCTALGARSVVGVALEPARVLDELPSALVPGGRGRGAHEVLAELVVAEDEDRVRARGEPVHELDGTGLQGLYVCVCVCVCVRGLDVWFRRRRICMYA